ncbi:MAG: diguanylate cyclase [Wenzhouxiangella sp.]
MALNEPHAAKAQVFDEPLLCPGALLEAIAQPALLHEASGRILAANRLAREFLGEDWRLTQVLTELEPRAGPVPARLLETTLRHPQAFWTVMIRRPGQAALVMQAQRLEVATAEGKAWVCIPLAVAGGADLLDQALALNRFGVWMWDIGTDEVRWSEQIFELFGIDPANRAFSFGDFLGRVHSADRDRVRDAIASALSSGRYDIEFRIRRDDGSCRFVRALASVDYALDGSPRRMIGSCQDLTEDRNRSLLLKRLVAVLNQSPDIIAVLDAQGRALFLNEAGREAFGDLPVADPVPETDAAVPPKPADEYPQRVGQFIEQYHPAWAVQKIVEEAMPAAMQRGSWTGETAIIDQCGHTRPVEQHVIAHVDPGTGQLLQSSTIMRDLRVQKSATAMLERTNSMMITVADAISEAFWVRRGMRVIYANQALGKMLGTLPDRICEEPSLLSSFFSRQDRDFVIELIEGESVFSEPIERECRVRHAQHAGMWVKLSCYPCTFPGRRPGCVATVVDITDLKRTEQALTEANSQLSRMAREDSLTGIPNRRALLESIRRELAHAERYGRPFSLLLLDLDHFKRVNDQFGHDCGDEVLRRITRAVQSRVRITDLFGRWGGEEFLVVLPATLLHEAAQIGEALRALVEAIDLPFDGTMTASLGVAEHTPGECRENLLKRVDIALYEAKAQGRNRIALAT